MMITAGSLVTSAAGLAHPAILLRRRPADSRPAACRIIRGGDADGAISERVHLACANDHALTVGDDEDFEGDAFERGTFGDAINLLLYRQALASM
jgi:hypothetical protein